MRLTLQWTIWTWLLGLFADAAISQSLAFLEPRANALTALGDTLKYNVGDTVTIRWNTAFNHTTLRVYQGPLDDGSYAQQVLARDSSPAVTSTTWKAAAIDGANLTHSFHFELVNGEDASCEDCTLNSIDFNVIRQTASSTSSVSSTSTALSTSTTSSASTTSSTTLSVTASPTPTTNAIAGAAASQAPTASSSISRKNLAVPLGVGLGVGIPVLLALCGLLAFCLLRRRKRQRASSLPRGRQHLSTPPASQAGMRERDGGSREPIFPEQAWIPGRTSHPRSSGGGASTNSSYFEPFEFERPESQEFDTKSVMSEVTDRTNAAARLDAIHEDRPMTPNWPLR